MYNSAQFKSFSTGFLFLAFVTVLMLNSNSSTAQNKNANNRYMHNETPDDEYLPMLDKDKKTSPAYRYRSSIFFTAQVNVDANGDNIIGDAANEPSIAVDPTNPDRIVIGWRQFDNVASNFRQAGYGYSTDAGQTWTFPEPINAGIFRSDPVLDFDNEGNFYYNSLTAEGNDYWCDVYKSEDGGAEWDDGTYAYGGDKQWMRIDRSNGIGDGNIYAFWNVSYSSCYPGSYTRSTDGGDNYNDCESIPGNPVWGTLTVGPDGELYTVGASSGSGLIVNKSITAQDPELELTWESQSYVDMDGSLSGWEPINPAGLLGQSYVDVDISDGEGRGNVYVLASVNRESNNDPGDVMFARSVDGGTTWDDPIRINTDLSTSNYQWFGTMSTAPNGRIDAVWLDTRNAPASSPYMSELYYSYSIDEGVNWSENERLSESFNPHVGWPDQSKMGDYFHMISHNDGAHLAWANTINGEQDVYYGYIVPWFVSIDEKAEELFSFINYPNPVNSKTTLRYELYGKEKVNITLYNILGNAINTITSEIQEAGMHNIVFDASHLTRGIYFCKLTVGLKTETIKLTLID